MGQIEIWAPKRLAARCPALSGEQASPRASPRISRQWAATCETPAGIMEPEHVRAVAFGPVHPKLDEKLDVPWSMSEQLTCQAMTWSTVYVAAQ